jgi:2-dehydro-3-deoxyphosphogluconate aldolase/(4S)-4-hydroxy-2-oxoglutarate aldolase
MTFLDSLRSSRLLGILRGIEFDELALLSSACKASGLKFVEITMNTPDAARKIARLVNLAEGAYQVGAGTVLTVEQLQSAVEAGATFIVSPVLVPEVAKAALANHIPFLPGALTPQDIYNCHVAGATVVKVFPVQCFGPSYLREVKGPLNDIALLACGGIRPDNLQAYLDSGADAVALGAGTFKREWLRDKNLNALSETLTAMVALAKTA